MEGIFIDQVITTYVKLAKIPSDSGCRVTESSQDLDISPYFGAVKDRSESDVKWKYERNWLQHK